MASTRAGRPTTVVAGVRPTASGSTTPAVSRSQGRGCARCAGTSSCRGRRTRSTALLPTMTGPVRGTASRVVGAPNGPTTPGIGQATSPGVRTYEGAIPTAPRLRGRSGEDCERDRDDDHQRHADQPEPEVATTDVLSSQNCSFRRGASQSVPPKSCSATPSAQRLRGLAAASGRGRAGGSRRHGFPRARCRARVPRSHPGLRRG
jgi:hypothetical protein